MQQLCLFSQAWIQEMQPDGRSPCWRGHGLQEDVAAWQEERQVSKYAENLEQLPATRKIPMDPKQVCTADGRCTLARPCNLPNQVLTAGASSW